jgi:pimeloyl-ACP methyl ester carboxylesterase
VVPEHWNVTSHTVDIDGTVRYLDFGGTAAPGTPPVVFVHGLGGSVQNWGLVAPAVAARTRAYAIDLPGFGLSFPAGRATTVRANAEVLATFLREVVGGPAMLVGNSMGGAAAMLVAGAHPELVAGLVLLDPVLPRATGAPLDLKVAAAFAAYAIPGVGVRALARRRRFPAEKTVADTLALCLTDTGGVPADFVAAAVDLTRERTAAVNEGRAPGLDAAFLQAARSVLRLGAQGRPYRALMRGLPQPVLLIHGSKDRLVPVASARAIAKHCPGWRYEELPGIGHCPMIEAPAAVIPLLIEWIAASAGAPATA